jgi:hypothetical protein
VDGEYETWHNKIDDGHCVITPWRDNMVKVQVLDQTYYLNAVGHLFEMDEASPGVFTDEWAVREFEE